MQRLDHDVPPRRELPAHRLALRRNALLATLTHERPPRRRRRLVAVAVAIATAGLLAAGATAVVKREWFRELGDGFGTSFEADPSAKVEGSFPPVIRCKVATGRLFCTPGVAPRASAARVYELDMRVASDIETPDAATSIGVGAGGRDARGRLLEPPRGVPPWIACSRPAPPYACEPVELEAKLPLGTAIYGLSLDEWVPRRQPPPPPARERGSEEGSYSGATTVQLRPVPHPDAP